MSQPFRRVPKLTEHDVGVIVSRRSHLPISTHSDIEEADIVNRVLKLSSKLFLAARSIELRQVQGDQVGPVHYSFVGKVRGIEGWRNLHSVVVSATCSYLGIDL